MILKVYSTAYLKIRSTIKLQLKQKNYIELGED